MTAILLPTRPLPQSAVPKPIDYGAWQEPARGGPITRLDQLGSRFAMDVTIPRLRPEPDGRIWVARLVKAIGGIVEMAFPQVGFDPIAPGSAVVDGADQSGMTIVLRGMTPNYPVREGQFFNLINGDQTKYLYMAAANTIVDNSGGVELPIWPMIRAPLPDGSATNFGRPVIQGRLSGNENGWTLQRAGMSGLQFTITEVK